MTSAKTRFDKCPSTPRISIVVPTRERANYIGAALRSCLLSSRQDYEVLVLDNASKDGTRQVVEGFDDPRLRYDRSDVRLSMRDNFERGLALARGDIIGFIGDDDGIFEHTPDKVIEIFERHDVGAVAAARAHYGWPDLTSARHDTGLLPRNSGITVKRSRRELYHLLKHSDYYRLPCIYHGFVKTSILRDLAQQQGRIFMSSQVDIYSSIGLSMQDFEFAYCASPLVINGGSSRSNGASHFGGGTNIEKTNWKKEDDLGFLLGFSNHATVGSLIIESALRYCQYHNKTCLHEIFEAEDIRNTMRNEAAKRVALGHPMDDFDQACLAAGLVKEPIDSEPERGLVVKRLRHLANAFGTMRPVDMRVRNVTDVFAASQLFSSLLRTRSTGFFRSPFEQIRIARQISSARAR